MAMDQFLKLEGIDGEAQDSSHTKEIDVLAWSWGASNSGTTHTGGGGGGGKVNVQDISVTKYIDMSSCKLMQYVTKGTHIPTAQLTVRKAGDTPLEYFVVKMKDIMVTSLSTGGSGGEDRLTENITLNFSEYKVEYKEQTATGSGGGTDDFAWNIAENVAA